MEQMNIEGYQKESRLLNFDRSSSLRKGRYDTGSESPLALPTINTDLYTDFEDQFENDLRKMYLNAIPTHKRRSQTKNKMYLAEKAKMAGLERIRA